MYIKPVTHWWDWRKSRTWKLAGLAALFVITATFYMANMFGDTSPTDTGDVTITEPVNE